MMPPLIRAIAAVAVVAGAVTAAGCGRAAAASSSAPTPVSAEGAVVRTSGDSAARSRARADSVRHPYTPADVHFMSGMIGHHAQAITMAGWAPTHGASSTVKTLAERIINAQRDEIRTMQQWLRDRGQPVPDAAAAPMAMSMHGEMHAMLMPGMLSDAQMKQLDAARGPEFDRLFLTFMIQHHRGALQMVKDLFGSWGAGQDELVFKFASDVNVDQTTEIARMQRMLFLLELDRVAR